MSSLYLRLVVLCVFLSVPLSDLSRGLNAQNIELEMRDRDSGAKVPIRFRFTKGEKQAGLPRNLLRAGKWTLLEDNVPIAPKPGEYEFLAHRGHEFTDIRGGFTVEKGARDVVAIEVPRATNMREEGWYSGDHSSNLPVKVLQRWQAAEAIDMVVAHREVGAEELNEETISKFNRKSKSGKESEEIAAGESEVGAGLSTQSYRYRSGGGSILFHPFGDVDSIILEEETKLSQVMAVLSDDETAKDYVPELEQLWSRDVPVLLSTNRIVAAQILNAANGPDGDAKLEFSPKGNPFPPSRLVGKSIKKRIGDEVFVPINEDDRIRYRDGRAIGLLSERIFWNILDTGLRITPTASNGFGEGESYLGYNRTYVHCDQSVSQGEYWASVGLGKTIVTNGPLLRVTVNDQFPGSTLASSVGEPIELSISASLSVRDPVDYLDVVFNGETIYSAKLEDHYRKGEFPPISIDKSGWLVIRVVTSHDDKYRFATTAPFYFEFDGQTRISTNSVNFMSQWLKLASESLLKENKSDDPELRSILSAAEAFWRERLEQANAP